MQRLIGDIGGTNARFALVGADGRPSEVRTLPAAGFPGLVEAAAAYLDGRPVAEAVIAVATPVEGDAVSFTNSHWSFSISEARARMGLERLEVINDFVAQALSVPHLLEGEREQIGPGAPLPGAPVGVIGAGTGLGVSGLVTVGERTAALATEGGHASLAPGTARERALLDRLAARFGHVSKERVLSGPGLLNAAQALAEIDGGGTAATTPVEVTRMAADGSCPYCAEAVATYSGLLGSASADLALTLGAKGGIYVAGGVSLGLGPLFDRALFRRRFEEKGRLRAYLAPIPTYLITRGDTGLLGAARHRLG
jgi:glucokinase